MLSPMQEPIYIENGTLYEINPKKIVNGTYTIPKSVKQIQPYAFEGTDELTTIVIPETVESIESSAFANCKNLKSVKIPNSVHTIPMNLFENCSSLEDVELPENVRHFGASVFKNCSSLKDINLPKNLVQIPPYTFMGCDSLESINLPKNVTSISNSAFKGCTSLKNVIGSEQIKEIELDAFSSCKSLEEIKLPEFMNELHDRAFKDCSSLKSFSFPRGIIKVYNETFENCTSLENFTFLGNTSVIDSNAFKNCASLKSITLPNNLYGIGSFAFSNCSALENINIPNSLRIINHSAFKGCSSLKSFKVNPLISVIENQTFANCTNLESLTIPESVWLIGYDAISNCHSLKTLKIPSSVKSMPNQFSDSLKFFRKTTDGFVIENEQTEQSIPLNNLSLNLALLSNNWNSKSILLREQNNPLYADFYNSFLVTLPKEDSKNFIEKHNFSMFKQVGIDIEEYNGDVYNFLYNIGAFQPPYEENGKIVNYAQKTVNFLIDKLKKENINIYKFAENFKNMKSNGFNKNFTDFFMENYDELLVEESKRSGFIVSCYNNFDEVQKTNTNNHGKQRQLKATIEKFKYYFAKDKFKGVTEENAHIAKTIAPYFNFQKSFDNAVSIDNNRKKHHIPNNILHKPLKESDLLFNIDSLASKINHEQAEILDNLALTADNEFTFEWLEKNDPENFILGKLCSCCSHLEGAGYGIMNASITHPHIQNIVIRDKNGEIVAKSTLYINHRKGYGVCNNVEVNTDVKGSDYDKIYAKYIMGINAFAKAYNKEHKFRKLRQINVGMSLNDLDLQIREHNRKSFIHLPAIHYSKYGIKGQMHDGDSFLDQYVLWRNDDNLFLDLNIDNLEKQ